MSFTPDQIGIYKVNGGGNSWKLNKDNCYFQFTGVDTTGANLYKFVADGADMATSLKQSDSFSFDYGGRNWTLKISSISTTAASGTWTDNRAALAPSGGDTDDGNSPGDQTFQAQAGQGTNPRPGDPDEKPRHDVARA